MDLNAVLILSREMNKKSHFLIHFFQNCGALIVQVQNLTCQLLTDNFIVVVHKMFSLPIDDIKLTSYKLLFL